MTELKMVYELVISRANPLDNPRYELLNHAQRKMKDEILNVIRQTNPNYPEMDYDDDCLSISCSSMMSIALTHLLKEFRSL